MRIACLQFAPQVGDVSNNMTRADAVLSKADPGDLEHLDLMVLPEMAFSGYNFKTREHIIPHVEPTGAGPSSQWACTTARKYGCTVAVGYPEKTDSQEQAPEYYNSLVVVDGGGEKVANYSKSFLYYTDATWAREGPGFYGGKLANLGQVAMGICMDINPYKFEAPWDAYEFAFHILRVRANLVVLSTAWLTNDERTSFLACPDTPDLSTLTYWVRRLEPVIAAESSEETIVVFANRCGVEDEATYAGTSTVLGIQDGEVSVYGILGRGVEELLVVDTDKPPLGKIIDPAKASVAGEPGAPPAPAPESEERPSKDADPGPAPGSGYVDSPTLPSGFAPSRNRTNLQPNITTTSAATKTPTNPSPNPTPNQTPKTTTKPHPRPKLSLQTNLPPILYPQFPTPPLNTIPQNQHTLSSPPADNDHNNNDDDDDTHHPATPTLSDGAIPIFVDVYTPDEPAWTGGWRDDCEGEGLAVDFHMDALSPWSVSGNSSPMSCGGGGGGGGGGAGGMIHVAASPSIFVGGGLLPVAGGVCV